MKLAQCVRNRQKYIKSKYASDSPSNLEPKRKKRRKILPVEPVPDVSGCEEEQLEAMKRELENVVVRDEVLKPLMTATFGYRQEHISSLPIAAICNKYPALKRPSIVSYMCMYIFCYNYNSWNMNFHW